MNLRFIATKVLRAIITLWMVVSFIFVILRVSGDPTDTMLPDDADAEMIEYYEKEVVAFQVIDNIDGDSARGDYIGNISGAMRPMLEWSTGFSPGD